MPGIGIEVRCMRRAAAHARLLLSALKEMCHGRVGLL